MEWSALINKRHNTFAWDYTRTVDLKNITDSIIEAYEHAPSKNQKYPFAVKVLKNNHQQELMTICHRNLDLTVEEDAGNPQVLAPYIIGFSRRDTIEDQTKEDYRKNNNIINYSCLEIGIQSTYIMLALANRGLDTGICSCIQDEKRAGILFGLPNECKLILGIGYSKGLDTAIYNDPRTDSEKMIPFAPKDKDLVYPKPAIDIVYQWET